METKVQLENNVAILQPMERIDFVSAPDFEKAIEENAEKAESMVLDMANVDYISSAGLRAILFADNLMSGKKGMSLKNVNAAVREILDISGFSRELKIE